MATKDHVLLRLPEKLHRHLEVLSGEEIDRRALYHISDNDRIRAFAPRVTSRMLRGEDRHIPRVSCSSDLTGAIAGHDGTDSMFNDRDFQGVFTLYELPFEFCIKPRASLVADASQTREYWLITYDRETEQYIPSKVGHFFYVSVTTYRPKQEIVYEMVLEVLTDGVYLTKTQALDKGYYRLIGRSPRVFKKNSATRLPMTLDETEVITKAQWNTLKETVVVHMESLGETKFMSW